MFFQLTTRWTGIVVYSDPREVSKTERHINDSIQLMKEKLVIELESTEKADSNGISNVINCSSSYNSSSKDEAIIAVSLIKFCKSHCITVN